MNTKNEKDDQMDSELFPIRAVSELTGVNSITLRAWEHRHNLLEPIRKASGHRLYTQAHIDLINRVVGLMDKGIRVSQVKAALAAEEENSTAVTRGASEFWQGQINSMIGAIIRFDEKGLERVYNKSLSLYPERKVTSHLLEPLLVDLGERWATGSGSVAEEHFLGFYLRNKLGARFHHRLQYQQGPLLLMAGIPGDLHEVGLLLFALAANDLGFRLVILGVNMPLEELPAATRKTGASAIVLSGLIDTEDDLISKGLPKLVRESPVPVYIGGRTSVINFDGLKSAGVHPMGSDIDTALKTLSDHLSHSIQ